MRICLVSSVNLSTWYNRDCEPAMLSLPLGLLSLAAVLEPLGHEVSLIDFNYALSQGKLSLGDGFYPAAVDRIAQACPELVGFSTMCNSYHIALRLAQAVKERLGVPVVLGGPQASVAAGETLAAFPFVDYILRGEAEQTLPPFVGALASGAAPDAIPGLTYRSEGHIVHNPDAPLLADLDSLPVPAYERFPYGPGSAPALDVGRGCPFDCSFCSTSRFWRRKFRLKSTERILQEMVMLKREHNATSFTFMHDLFTINRRRLHAFCDRLQAEKLDVTWSCSARSDCVDPILLRHMADAGCRAIFYGVESGSPRMQREIGKHLKLDQVWSAVEATLDAGMGATVSFIAGFPNETERDLRQTMDMVQALLGRSAVNVQLHLLAPALGTLDYARYREQLRYDGYFSDIAGAAYQFLEPDWFEHYPDLFASFHYFETGDVPRDFLRGLDLFVHGPCAAMRGTVARLLAPGRSLWGLYGDWRDWCRAHGRGGGPTAGQILDEFLLDFYDFACAQVAAGRADFDLGFAQDEVLTFYLQYYGAVPVRYVPSTRSETRPVVLAAGG